MRIEQLDATFNAPPAFSFDETPESEHRLEREQKAQHAGLQDCTNGSVRAHTALARLHCNSNLRLAMEADLGSAQREKELETLEVFGDAVGPVRSAVLRDTPNYTKRALHSLHQPKGKRNNRGKLWTVRPNRVFGQQRSVTRELIKQREMRKAVAKVTESALDGHNRRW